MKQHFPFILEEYLPTLVEAKTFRILCTSRSISIGIIMTTQMNQAAWILEPKGDLSVLSAPYPVPMQDEIVIKVCNLALFHPVSWSLPDNC